MSIYRTIGPLVFVLFDYCDMFVYVYLLPCDKYKVAIFSDVSNIGGMY